MGKLSSRRRRPARRRYSRRWADISVSRPTPHRQRARRGEGPRLRSEILEAAERLLISTGDEAAVSIRAVAEAVGVTPPSIYLHFADRNELIFAVCEEQFRHLNNAMELAVAGVADPMERLKRRGDAYLEFGLENPEQYRVLMMGRPDCTPERFLDGRLIGTLAFQNLLDDVQAAIDAGAIRFTDPVVVASGLWMHAHGITSLLIAKPDFPWPNREELLAHMQAVYMAGLKSGHS